MSIWRTRSPEAGGADELEARLAAERPEPSAQFLASMLRLLGGVARPRSGGSRFAGRRRLAAAVLSVGVVAAAAAFGAIPFAGHSAIGEIHSLKRTFEFSGDVDE